jgi:glycogen debranching enzyme
VPEDTISILDGNAFVVGNRRGDIDAAAGRPHGFYVEDTRFISRLRLSIDEQPPDLLSVADHDYFATQFYLVPQAKSIYQNSYISVIRRRLVGDGMLEELTVINHLDAVATLGLRLDIATDFADVFEAKDGEVPERDVDIRVVYGELVFAYRNEDFERETRLAVTLFPDGQAQPTDLEQAFDGGECLRFGLELAPHEQWHATLAISARSAQRGRPARLRAPPTSYAQARAEMNEGVRDWLERAPVLECDWEPMRHIYRRSLLDLAALRFYDDALPQSPMPAAGLPWFMTLFGRDSLIASYQALPFYPELAQSTLRVLAARQGSTLEDFREEEPGKIPHELRRGELTATGKSPHSPYYGTADATPLFLILLEETVRWTGDLKLASDLEPNARAALEWIDSYGDADGDGYVEYERRNKQTGLENQCWKDSWNSILFANGELARAPIATCEIQGYVYAAKLAGARLAREYWNDEALAQRLEREAGELQTRFEQDFWLEQRGYYALALDRDKRPVDSLTSNIGHLLWSEIVSPERAEAIRAQLMADRLFSGWGVRTMAVGNAGNNPIEYHNGTVWPHDNSLIAAGLTRYGYHEDAGKIMIALLRAASRFANRLPEVFAGYDRELTYFPVEYPTASRPQAWATGTPLMFIRTMLALESRDGQLTSEPTLFNPIGHLALRGVRGRWGKADATAGPRRPPGPVKPAAILGSDRA